MLGVLGGVGCVRTMGAGSRRPGCILFNSYLLLVSVPDVIFTSGISSSRQYLPLSE